MNYATERLLAAANASLAAWQDEEQSVRVEHREPIDELEGAIFYFDAHGAKPEPTRVLVALEGGIVQGAVADRPGVAVTVLDYDTDGADASTVYAIPQDGGGTADAYMVGHSADHDPAFIDRAEAAALADPAEAIAELRARAAAFGTDYPALAAEELARAAEIEEGLTETQPDPLRALEPTD